MMFEMFEGVNNMKICFSVSGQDKESMLNPRFGRCPYFLIFNDKDRKWATVDNQAAAAFRGAGISAAQKIVDLGCQVIVTGNMGPNAFNVMSASGIKIYLGDLGKSVVDNLKMYQENKLQELSSPRGMGMSRGRRRQ